MEKLNKKGSFRLLITIALLLFGAAYLRYGAAPAEAGPSTESISAGTQATQARNPEDNVTPNDDGDDGDTPPVVDDDPAPACEYKQIRGDMVGIDPRGRIPDHLAAQVYDSSFGSGCFQQIRNDVVGYVQEKSKHGDQVYWDDEYNYWFSVNYVGGEDTPVGKLPNGAYCDAVTKYHRHEVLRKGVFCTNFRVAYDKNCQRVDWDVAAAACGGSLEDGLVFRFIKSSPISLIWSPGYDIESEASIVNFALEKGNRSCIWKASAEAPLLVFDPGHKGEIKSATQLLGHWAFGGKTTASLSTTSSPVSAQPWADGYEALASLDRDKSGAVDGNELAPLALWFDQNRDAKAQAGEVRPVTELGIKALYFTADRRDPLTGNIHAGLGYEREVDGKIVKGASVDWFGESAGSQGELAARFYQGSPALDRLIDSLPAEQNTELAEHSETATNSLKFPELNGLWNWKYEYSGANSEADGSFVFKDAETGPQFAAFVITEAALAKIPNRPESKLRSIVQGSLVTGSKTIQPDGSLHIAFESKNNHATLRNTARLSSDGKILAGETQAAYSEGGVGRRLHYKWTAERVRLE